MAAKALISDDSAPHSTSRPSRVKRIVTRGGAAASIAEREGHEVVTVHDRAGRVLFEYDADTGRGSLVAAGGLSLQAPDGDIDLVAGGAIRGWAAGEISLTSASGASIGARAGDRKAGIRVSPERVTVAGEEIAVGAEKGDLRVGDARYHGRVLTSVIERVHTTAGKLESIAGRVIARADDLFQEVRALHELRAGRLRALVDGAIEMRGDEVRVDAREDVSIDGKRIQLG